MINLCIKLTDYQIRQIAEALAGVVVPTHGSGPRSRVRRRENLASTILGIVSDKTLSRWEITRKTQWVKKAERDAALADLVFGGELIAFVSSRKKTYYRRAGMPRPLIPVGNLERLGLDFAKPLTDNFQDYKSQVFIAANELGLGLDNERKQRQEQEHGQGQEQDQGQATPTL